MDSNSNLPITLDFVPTDIRVHFDKGRPVSCVIEGRNGGGVEISLAASRIDGSGGKQCRDSIGNYWSVTSQYNDDTSVVSIGVADATPTDSR